MTKASATFIRDGTKRERRAAVALLILAAVYLAWFVPRGWVPFDEGMIGETAEWVLRGALPHVDYQEPYTGGLTWLYAALFGLVGVDLVNVRWLLYGASSLSLVVIYAVLRRFLAPLGAALATWVALAWSFPNYFAGLPSWWLLICALGCVWALFRHIETDGLRHAALAGLLAGCAIIIKQTGVYVLLAVVTSLLVGTRERPAAGAVRGLDKWLRFGVCACAVVFAAMIMRTRLGPSEIAYLLVPIAASSLALTSPRMVAFGSAFRSRLLAVSLACGTAALPLIVLLVPYVVSGHLGEFVAGTVLLPQKRFTFASGGMPPLVQLVPGVAIVIGMLPLPSRLSAHETRVLNIARWVLVSGLAAAGFWSALAHQVVFGSVRAVAALLPTVIAAIVLSGRMTDDRRRRLLFACSSMLAWASLVQFPAGLPAYLCYVMPLAVIAAVAAAEVAPSIPRPGVPAWTALLLIFALFSMNRGYAGTIGVQHLVYRQDVPLNLEKAHLKVRRDHADAYRRLVALVDAHAGTGDVLAGPDCPEVYFLTNRLNPSGVVFEFFSSSAGDFFDADKRAAAKVIVVNGEPEFSPAVKDSVVAQLRVDFPFGEQVGPFEVRWR
jgi:hypothetical protein